MVHGACNFQCITCSIQMLIRTFLLSPPLLLYDGRGPSMCRLYRQPRSYSVNSSQLGPLIFLPDRWPNWTFWPRVISATSIQGNLETASCSFSPPFTRILVKTTWVAPKSRSSAQYTYTYEEMVGNLRHISYVALCKIEVDGLTTGV